MRNSRRDTFLQEKLLESIFIDSCFNLLDYKCPTDTSQIKEDIEYERYYN